MQMSRRAQATLSRAFNEYLPPAVRDARWFMRRPMRLVFGRQADLVMDFKPRACELTDAEIADVYRELSAYSLALDSDLNGQCIERIASDVAGATALDVGCGAGALAERLSPAVRVTACDIVLRPDAIARVPAVRFVEANVECLPFDDAEFDTVACTHTLEHARDLPRAVAELRRVARRRVIIVVPKERPYRYTFNLHLHFFPYDHTLLTALGAPARRAGRCDVLGGDLYYREDIERA
jgi:ubiquinone/menaquinone biosynthesis C-methylase UbiE